MSIANHIPGDIKRVARSVGYAAWLNTPDEWLGLPAVLEARLSVETRAALSFAALKSLPYDTAWLTFDVAFGIPTEQGAGQPMAPLLNYMDQAAFWADIAEQSERDAYMLAAYQRAPAHRQAAFLEFVQGRKAA